MKASFITLLFLSFCIACGNKAPIFYNTCGKSDSFNYYRNTELIIIHQEDSLFQSFCQYLSDTKKFGSFTRPKDPRPHDTYRFDFKNKGKTIKSIYILRWIDPDFFALDDWGWSKRYNADVEQTKKLLKSLGLMHPDL